MAALDAAASARRTAATLVRDRLRVAVVGDITPAELGPLLDRLFGALAGDRAAAAAGRGAERSRGR